MGPTNIADDLVIDVLKVSTLEWMKGIFPYDSRGKLVNERMLETMHPEVYRYLLSNKDLLDARSAKGRPSEWYAFGRSQAIKDVFSDKVAVGMFVKEKNPAKIEHVPAGKGLCSGFYVLSPMAFPEIKEMLGSDTFLRYVKVLRKYKSGGWYTFSSKDLEKYLVWASSDPNGENGCSPARKAAPFQLGTL
jgi:adenine-specific DNA-methyltransferase